ncbi:MAG: hypothetical protein K8L99_22055 [Anaerolineae bacterium]|nr:hypothetical protein [Anaerolineae bacterium]
MVESVLVGHHLGDRLVKVLQRTVQTVGNGKLLEVQPEALNGIEKAAWISTAVWGSRLRKRSTISSEASV